MKPKGIVQLMWDWLCCTLLGHTTMIWIGPFKVCTRCDKTIEFDSTKEVQQWRR